jgi:hypothetical protein
VVYLFTSRGLEEGGLLEEGEGKGKLGTSKGGRGATTTIVSNISSN